MAFDYPALTRWANEFRPLGGLDSGDVGVSRISQKAFLLQEPSSEKASSCKAFSCIGRGADLYQRARAAARGHGRVVVDVGIVVAIEQRGADGGGKSA